MVSRRSFIFVFTLPIRALGNLEDGIEYSQKSQNGPDDKSPWLRPPIVVDKIASQKRDQHSRSYLSTECKILGIILYLV